MMKKLGYLFIIMIILFGCINFDSKKQQTEPSCGGIAGINCPEGYVCQYEDNGITDNAGKCIRIMYDPPWVEEARRNASGLCSTERDYEVNASNPLNCTCPQTFKLNSTTTNETGNSILKVRCVYER